MPILKFNSSTEVFVPPHLRDIFVKRVTENGYHMASGQTSLLDQVTKYPYVIFYNTAELGGNSVSRHPLISIDDLFRRLAEPEVFEHEYIPQGEVKMAQEVTKFNMPKITEYVQEVLVAAGLSPVHAPAYVKLAIERKKRFHSLGFNEFGRLEIPFTVTPQILLEDYRWFRQMLEEMGIKQDHLCVMMGKIYVLTARGGGAPLTKELSKKADQLFAPGKHWFDHYEYASDVNGKPDAFLARLGDVINLGKKAVVSINPGDILRKSMQGKYAAYTSCHNLRNGAYRQGPVSYSLDASHVINYITDGGDIHEKMHGRSMMVISNDLNVVAQRRFYPSPEVFGESRARAIREAVQKLINPGVKWLKSNSTNLIQPSMQVNGYSDGIAVATYLDGSKKFGDTDLCKDIFCFGCGKVHQRTGLFCGTCGGTQKTGMKG